MTPHGGPSAGQHDQVCVFGPSTIVTVTVETGTADDEIHFHAGGQGFWIARLLGRLGIPVVLCTALGGESGLVAETLVEAEAIDLRAVRTSTPNGAWIHDRRTGDRSTVAENTGRTLERHELDELYGATLAAALASGICVFAGPHRPDLVPAEVYRRLAGDLRANGVTVISDLSGACLLAALEGGVDFCKISDEDLAETDGFDPAVDPSTRLRQVIGMGADHAAITRGSEPLLASIEDTLCRVTSPSLTAIDHRGAGDAFTALVAASRFWGLDWNEAVRWGAAAGALTVVRRGLATADRREIHQLLGLISVEPMTDQT